MSDSQKQLLKTMLFYELQNYVMIELINPELSKEKISELKIVKAYLEKRIEELK